MKTCPGDGLRGCLVYIAPAQDRCRFCERSRQLRYHSPRALPQIVPGEEELGEQRQCIRCLQWWPFTDEFYRAAAPSDRGSRSRICRGCRLEAAYAKRFPAAVAA